MRKIKNLEELKSLIGQEIAISDWIEISQERINNFAEATDDYQWVHVDVERAKRESPFGSPIAHGFLTLSLLPKLIENAIKMTDVKMGLNYGLNKVRFPAPVLVGSKLRGRFKLLEVKDITGGAQLIFEVIIECEGSDKPVCVAESIMRRY